MPPAMSHSSIPAAVAFDLDGVLVDTYEIWYRVLNATRAHFGLPEVPRGDYAQLWGQGIDDDIDLWFPGCSREDLETAYDSRFPAFLEEVRVQPGAPETLGRLRALDVPLAVITNCPGAVGHSVLEHAGLSSCFRAVLTASDVEREKPAPDMVLEAARRLGAEPGDMVVVGDTDVDRKAARSAGAPFVLFAGFDVLSGLWGLSPLRSGEEVS